MLLHQTMQLLLHIPCRTNIKKFALCFQGPKFFNSLNIEIQNVGTFSLFEYRKCKGNSAKSMVTNVKGSRVIALHLGLRGGFRNTPDSKQNNTNIPSETKLPLIIHVSLYKYKNKQYDIPLSPFYYSSISTILRSGYACD